MCCEERFTVKGKKRHTIAAPDARILQACCKCTRPFEKFTIREPVFMIHNGGLIRKHTSATLKK